MRLFIVDDDDAIRMALDLQLRQLGLTHVQFASSLEALRFARAKPPEIAVVDFNLPMMTGLQLIKALKQENKALRALLITGDPKNSAVVQATADGTVDILVPKPWKMWEMVEQVRRLVALADSGSAPPSPAQT